MANLQCFIPNGGPGINELIRFALIETSVSGIYRLTLAEVGDNTTRPSLASSLAAAASRLNQAGDRPVIVTAAAALTLTAADSGAVVVGTLAGTQTFTLPEANVNGLNYHFTQTTAAGEILVNPGNATDVFQLKATVDAGASIVTAAGVGIKNTAATNVVGDLIWIISNGAGRWIMLTQSGIWASQ